MEANKDAFWFLYVDYKYNEWFCRYLKDEAHRCNTAILALSALFSLGSVSAWGIWSVVPLLWATIVMAMQVVQACRPYLPFFDWLTAFRFFLPQLSDLLIDMEDNWLRMEAYSKEEIADLILKYKRQYKNLDCTYLENVHLPIRGRTYDRVSAKAVEQCLNYFSQKYNVRGEIIGTSTKTNATTATAANTATAAKPSAN